MIRRLLTIAFVFLFSVPLAAQQQPTAEELEQRVRELERRIEAISTTAPSAEIEEIRRQIDILTQEIEALKVGRREARADTQQYGLGEAASKVYRTDEGISFGGYGEFLYENYDTETDRGTPSNRTDQLDVLRAILYVGYKFTDRVIFNSELEFEHGTTGGPGGVVSVEFAYLDFMLNPAFNIRAGHMLMPVGIVNELHEPTAFLGAKRPDLERAIIPSTWREPGVGVFGEFGDVSYRSYVVTGLDARRFSAAGIRGGRQSGANAKAENFAWVTRVDYEPLEGLRLGGSFYTGGAGQDLRTTAGNDVDVDLTLTELHADFRARGAWLRGIWTEGKIDGVSQLNAALSLTGNRSVGSRLGGWYAEAGYDFAPFFLPATQSLTPFLRFENYDSQKRVPAGFTRDPQRDVELLTGGVAWKPIPQAVVKFEIQNYDNAAGTGVDQFNIALGYIF
jgi:Ni/Co efflux regulator RcnB